MNVSIRRLATGCLVVGGAIALSMLNVDTAAPACDPDNGGLKLPAGFCAAVVADGNPSARHLVVAANGDVYVALQGGRGAPGGVVALRDKDGDGKLETKETFGTGSITGIGLRNGYLYTAKFHSVERV